MSPNAIAVPPAPATHPGNVGTPPRLEFPADTPFLPGRTVTDGMNHGVVIAVPATDVVAVRWPEGITEVCAVAELRAVHPDRPTLAYDSLFAAQLGEELAARAGQKALDGFHRGHNDGRVAFTEAARGILRRIDERAVEVKHCRCPYTHVVDSAGVPRADRVTWEPGDTLVTCPFFGDGPGNLYCGAHGPGVRNGSDPSSIFYATPEQYVSGEAVVRAPCSEPHWAAA